MRVSAAIFGSILIWVGSGSLTQAEAPASFQGSPVEPTTVAGGKPSLLGSSRAIVEGGRLEDEWRERQRTAKTDGSAAAQFQAAWWALEQGLTPEAISTLRSAATAPGALVHTPMSRANRMLARLEAQVLVPDTKPVQHRLGGEGWAELPGRHVVLLHQATQADAAERLDVLDRVVETFYLSLAAQGIELQVPSHRLISVWFARQSDYIHLLRQVEAGPFTETQGYYHPTFGVVFAYDTRSSHEQVQARRTLAELGRSPESSTERSADLKRQLLLLDLRWRSVDLGIAAHETIHQLVAASGLAPRFDAWPIWLHEGFSTQFEVVRSGRWAGFGRTNDLRLPDWRSNLDDHQLAPLLRDEGLTHGYRRVRYAESWALVYFLRKTRPREFVTLLDLLKAPQTSGQRKFTADTFIAVFGPSLDELQSDWRRFMRQQTTPLDD